MTPQRLPTPPPTDPDDFEHLIVADTRPLPSLDEVKHYYDEVLRRDVADEALCGWTLPGKHFSRLIWSEYPAHDVCEKCLQVVIDKQLDSADLCVVPSANWDWETQ